MYRPILCVSSWQWVRCWKHLHSAKYVAICQWPGSEQPTMPIIVPMYALLLPYLMTVVLYGWDVCAIQLFLDASCMYGQMSVEAHELGW